MLKSLMFSFSVPIQFKITCLQILFSGENFGEIQLGKKCCFHTYLVMMVTGYLWMPCPSLFKDLSSILQLTKRLEFMDNQGGLIAMLRCKIETTFANYNLKSRKKGQENKHKINPQIQ